MISRVDAGTAQGLVLAAAATAFGVIALALRLGEEATTGGPLDYTLVVVAGVALLAARRWPLPVLILTLGLHLRLTAVTGAGLAAFPAFAVALYIAARTGRRRERFLICVLVAACSAVIVSAPRQGTLLVRTHR